MRKVISILLLFIALGTLMFFLYSEQDALLSIFLKLDIFEFLALILTLLSIFFISGYRISVINKSLFDKKLNLQDIFILPLAMSFAGYAIPVKGGSVYQVLFLKKYYDLDFSKSSINLIINQFIPITIIGLIGALGCLYFWNFSMFVLFSLSALSLPLVLVLFLILSILYDCLIQKDANKINLRIQLQEIYQRFRNLSFILSLVCISLFKIILEILFFVLIFNFLDIDFHTIQILSFVLIRNISIIIKLFPGNIGVNEILAGLYTEFIGETFVVGVSIMLVMRLISILITMTFGVYFFFKKNVH